MDSIRIRIRQGPVRALIAVCLLVGVFAMHGLTGNHDVAMALTNQPPATAAHHSHTITATAMDHHDQALAPADSGALQAASALTMRPGHDGHLHSMGDVCLAMLAALLLALIVALAQRSLTIAHPAVQAAAAIRVTIDGPSPPWRRPTLSKLCVLRT